jgi:crotonobetaine/carnitine-CoA ligase
MISGNRQRWTIRDVALHQLAAVPERPFVSVFGEDPETFAAFIGASAKLANALAACGVGRASPVAILCPTGLPHLHAWLACGLLGATEVPINPVLRGGALEHVLRMTKPAVAVVDRGLLPHVLEAERAVGCLTHLILVGEGEPADLAGRDIILSHYDDVLRTGSAMIPDAQVSTADIGSVMFTSGTTGPAKGAMMPNGQLCLLALQALEAMRIGGDDVFYCAHPLNHIAGKYMGIFATFAAGGRVVLDGRFEAANWLDRVRACGATLSIAHGPMIEMIAAQPPRPEDSQHALRRLMCCPMPKHLAADFETRFALKGVEMWGMTEVACPAWTSLDGPRVEGSCGRPLRDYYDLRIVDPETDEEVAAGAVGEIVVRPRFPFTTMQGYLGMPSETLDAWRNLWFHTGDAAYLDTGDNLFFVDRLKDRIRRRAENISAYDIEVAAMAFAPVREAAAVGVPSGFEGDDDIKLCIVPDGPVEPAKLIAFLAGRLPPFMVPRYVEVLDALPRTPTNKIRKRDLSSAGITAATWDRSKENVRLRDLYGTAESPSLM